jgi:hypothetical protein
MIKGDRRGSSHEAGYSAERIISKLRTNMLVSNRNQAQAVFFRGNGAGQR